MMKFIKNCYLALRYIALVIKLAEVIESLSKIASYNHIKYNLILYCIVDKWIKRFKLNRSIWVFAPSENW